MSAVLFWVGLDILLGPAIVVEASPAATAGNANKSRLQCYNVLYKLFPQVGESGDLADCTALSTSPADACAILASCGEGIDPIAG